MFQKLFRICSSALICTVLFNAQKGVSSEINPECCAEALEESLPSGSTFHVVSTEDLYLAKEGILVNINGYVHLVNSLKRTGNQWLVAYDHYDPRYQCPWGHSLCGYCHMCHKRICSDYIPRCSASK